MKNRNSKKPVKTKAKVAKPEAEVENNEETGSPAETENGDETLSSAQREQLVTLEKVIASAQTQFEEVGRALHLINTNGLYKGPYKTFEIYCDEKWGMADKHAYRLIKSFNAMKVLREAEVDADLLPKNEYQVRVLLDRSNEEKWHKDWNKVLKAAKHNPAAIKGSLVEATLGSEKDRSSTSKSSNKEVVGKVLKWIDESVADLDSVKAAQELLAKIKKELQKLTK